MNTVVVIFIPPFFCVFVAVIYDYYLQILQSFLFLLMCLFTKIRSEKAMHRGNKHGKDTICNNVFQWHLPY